MLFNNLLRNKLLCLGLPYFLCIYILQKLNYPYRYLNYSIIYYNI